MDFLNGIVALIAFVVLILTALVAWMYVQQTRLLQAVSALTAAVTAPPPSFYEATKEFPIPEETEEEKVEEVKAEVEEEKVDDRVSVHEEDDEESIEDGELGPPAEEDDDLSSKTIPKLREMLTAKGIPYNKSDKKPVLVNLLKATA